MDRTYTPMGARFMRQAITRPLVSAEAVLARQGAVGELHAEHGARDEFAGLLKSMGDMERLAARVGSERANARDLIALKAALHVIPVIKEKLAGLKAGLSAGLRDGLQELRPLAEKLERALVDDPPLSLTEGGLIRAGYNEELDDLRVISSAESAGSPNCSRRNASAPGSSPSRWTTTASSATTSRSRNRTCTGWKASTSASRPCATRSGSSRRN